MEFRGGPAERPLDGGLVATLKGSDAKATVAFAEIARLKSQDPGSASNGAGPGWSLITTVIVWKQLPISCTVTLYTPAHRPVSTVSVVNRNNGAPQKKLKPPLTPPPARPSCVA